MTRERRMIAVVSRQVREQELHTRLVMIEPDHFLADLRAVRRDRVSIVRVAQIQVSLEVLFIEREAGSVDQLLDRRSLRLHPALLLTTCWPCRAFLCCGGNLAFAERVVCLAPHAAA